MTACLDPTREGRIRISTTETFDVLVIGGGITGAAAAREAAMRGYSVALLEAFDYGRGTSARSSKILHGGVRYLEQGDIGLVREALLEREIILASAPHLCRVQKFLFPVIASSTRPSWQIGIGLKLYDFLANPFGLRKSSPFGTSRKLSSESAEAIALRECGLKFTALYEYFDGQMNDARLVVENILDAASLGAVTLNHARLNRLTRLRGGAVPPPRRLDPAPVWRSDWTDELTGEKYRTDARYVINAIGPWSAELPSMQDVNAELPELRFSAGTHLVFNRDIKLPGVILATGIAGRYYFVLPYFTPFGIGTLVGPTHREAPCNVDDPQPSADEVDELLRYLKRDLPDSGLNERSLYRSFCGMRVLVSKGQGGNISDVSRKDEIARQDAWLSVIGGKYTTARLAAERGVNLVDDYFGRSAPRGDVQLSSRSRKLPGARNWSQGGLRDIENRLAAAIVLRRDHAAGETPTEDRACELSQIAVNRFGMRAERLLELESGLKICRFSPTFDCLEGEIDLAKTEEQAATADDICLGRLGIAEIPGDVATAIGSLKKLNS